VADKTRLMGTTTSTIGWPDWTALCATSLLHRGLVGGYPMSIQSLSVCYPEERNNSAHHCIHSLTGWKPLCASWPLFPKLFSGLSPEPRCWTLLTVVTVYPGGRCGRRMYRVYPGVYSREDTHPGVYLHIPPWCIPGIYPTLCTSRVYFTLCTPGYTLYTPPCVHP